MVNFCVKRHRYLGILLTLFLTGFLLQYKASFWNNGIMESQVQRCSEQRHIAFVKVHKAASTTVTTILQRFGFSRNLTFAIPKSDSFHIGLFESFHPRNVMPILPGAEYEIVCQHVVYNKEAFQKYLPADTKVIASVRNPVDKFLSTFFYFPEYIEPVKDTFKDTQVDNLDLLRRFLSRPEYYEPEQFRNGSLIINRLSFDFGIPKQQYRNSTFVKEYIQMLDQTMFFVIVSEYFDESLVILKRKLCWSTKDIIYKKQHRGLRRKPPFTDDIVSRIQELQPSDFTIYQHFLNKYKSIASKEHNLKEEVMAFRVCLTTVHNFCRNFSKSPDDILRVNGTDFSDGFTFDNEDCFSLFMLEINAVRRLKEKQKSRLKLSYM